MRALREERAWTQDGAGVKADVSRVTIGKIEHGTHVLPRTFDKYAAVYDTSLRQLLQDLARDDLDEESRTVGRSYRLASTPVRQAITALLQEHTGHALAILVLAIVPRFAEDPKGVEARVRQALDTPPPPLSERK